MSQSPKVQRVTSSSATSVSGCVPTGVVDRERPNQSETTKDGGWGWVVVLGSCICHFFLVGINRSMGIVYLLLQEQFDATGKETALAASIFVSFRALGGPVASKLSDRFGCRAVTVTGGLLLCVGLLLTAFAINITNVYITLGVVAGVGSFLVFSPSYIAVSNWFDKKKGKAMSLSTLGTGFGSIVMGPLIMMLVSYYGYFGTMLITSGLMLNNSVGGALYRPPPEETIIQGVNVAGVKEEKKGVDLKNETVVEPVGNELIAGEKNAMELRAMPVKKITEGAQNLGAFVKETAAEKGGNLAANPIEKMVEEQADSAEKSSSAKLEVSEAEAVPGKSPESGSNFEEKTGDKFSEADRSANHNIIRLTLENSEDLKQNQFDESRVTVNLGDPLHTNGGIDGPVTSINMNVDSNMPLPKSQLTSIPEIPKTKTTINNGETESDSGDEPRCIDRCPSPLTLFSFFKSSLWFNVPFILYCAMIIATQGCIQSVLIFLPGRGRELGATRQQESLLLTVFGAADMLGRFVFGVVFDLRFLRDRRTPLYTGVAAFFAALTVLLGFMPSYISLAIVTALVAFFEGGAHSQRATNVLELVEPSQLSIGVGLVIFAQGVGNFYGPIVGGALKDLTGSFSTSFIFGGTSLLCACLLTVLFNIVRSHTDKRKKLKGPDTTVNTP